MHFSQPTNVYLVLFTLLFICLGCSSGSENSEDDIPTEDPVADNSGGSPTTVMNDEPSNVDSSIWSSDSFDYKGRRELDQNIASGFTSVSYKYHVYLPPEYDLEPNRSFPVLYFTDGEWYSDFQFKSIDFESIPIIAVGIEHGGRRATDYVWPGAQTYHRFLVEEFVPFVESQYRILQDERTLKGDSGGGSQTLISMFLDDESRPVFKSHLAFDPFIRGIGNTNIQRFIDLRMDIPMNKNLVITSMRGGFHSTVDPFVTQLKSSNIVGLKIYQSVYDLDHTDATWSSFSNALKVIYAQ